MRVIFTLLCIKIGDSNLYTDATARLIDEILTQSNHDILLSTNATELQEKFRNNNRVIVRDNITNTNNILKYSSEFNYNLKYLAFENIPSNYDLIIYLDCDIKLDGWNLNSDCYLENLFMKEHYNFGATRLNCLLRNEVNQHRTAGRALFSHKIQSYKILDYSDTDDIMLSVLPSEHFLIFKNDNIKVNQFYSKWKQLNDHLQSINGSGGSWGDGFEIGISARYAGFCSPVEIDYGSSINILGFKFNGNKYI